MKKINLIDIMESLNSGDMENAQAALHEWFVEQGKKVHAGLTGQTMTEAGGEFYAWTESSSGAQMFYGPYASQEEASHTAGEVEGTVITSADLSDEEKAVLAGFDKRGWKQNGSIEVDLASDEDVYAVCDILNIDFDEFPGDEEDMGIELGKRLPHMELMAISRNEGIVTEAGGEFYAWSENSSGAQMFYGPYTSQEEAAQTASDVDGKVIASADLSDEEKAVLAGFAQRGWNQDGYVEVDLANEEDVSAVCDILNIDFNKLSDDEGDIGIELGKRLPHLELMAISRNQGMVESEVEDSLEEYNVQIRVNWIDTGPSGLNDPEDEDSGHNGMLHWETVGKMVLGDSLADVINTVENDIAQVDDLEGEDAIYELVDEMGYENGRSGYTDGSEPGIHILNIYKDGKLVWKVGDPIPARESAEVVVGEANTSDDFLNQVDGHPNIVPDVSVSSGYASVVYEVTNQSGVAAVIDMDTSVPYYQAAEVAKDALESAFETAGSPVAEEELEVYASAISSHMEQILEYIDNVEESIVEPTFEDLVAELQESFQGLETVSDKLQNVEGAQVGEEGKVPVNTKATLPSKKGDKRLGGEAVEIKGKGHTGHALEKAPKVKDAPVKHHVQNSKDDPKKVSAPKGALLNKMDGSVNTQSPISGKGAKGLKK